MAASPHLSRSRVLPSPAFCGSLRRPLHPGFFCRRPSRPRRPPLRHARPRPDLRTARHPQHPCLRRLCFVLRPKPHLSRRESPPAQSQTRRSRLAPSRARPPRAHEPLQRARRPRFYRRRHRSGFYLGRPPHRPVLVLRSQVRGNPARTRTLRRLSAALPHNLLARRQSLPALHLQFRDRDLEFHGGEPVPLSLPPLFLMLSSCCRGALQRVPVVVASLSSGFELWGSELAPTLSTGANRVLAPEEKS